MGLSEEHARIMFMYWGRRGAMVRFTRDLAAILMNEPALQSSLSLSRSNEAFAEFAPLGEKLHPVETFARGYGALTNLWRVPLLRRDLAQRIKQDRIEAVVNLMPHVWTPLVAPAIRAAGAKFITIVHDPERHPGDWTGLVLDWQLKEMKQADHVVTLSQFVATRLAERYPWVRGKLTTLFHPDFGETPAARPRPLSTEGQPFRLLYFGRALPYKGLDLLVDAVELVRARGLNVSLGFFGEGNIEAERDRLVALHTEIENRWIAEAEIEPIFGRHDALVLSYTSASQSGVAAFAAGAGIPVIATPVGGLIEQVNEGQLGIIARDVSAEALADAIEELARDPARYDRIVAGIEARQDSRSMRRFVQEIAHLAATPG